MKRIKIRHESAPLLEQLVKKGYIIENGKSTKALSNALSRGGIEFYRGYDQEAKKMILAIEKAIKIKPKKRTLKCVFFEFE